MDARTTDSVLSLQYHDYNMYITHEYFTYTDSGAEINKNIALTLVTIIVRILE